MAGFTWDILSPSPSGPGATSPAPMAAVTTIDLDEGGPADVVIQWGDGTTNTIHIEDFESAANHTFRQAGTYHAVATLDGDSRELTFYVLGLGIKPRVDRVSFRRV